MDNIIEAEGVYEARVSRLELEWKTRIEAWAAHYVRTNRGEIDVQLAATDDLASRLLKSEKWENVTAVDISDIAYEAVGRVLDSGE